ncbi:odorant receptor 33c-like [Contarinia nasturtii]|uniref:odorant receptor 33c-like n=1 Tax=Contarinia nasturtii TaxID=265458 RepID=UPI0012D44179|nr:odorant receptor 33c-like [Contarinia nasturtii]
MQFVTFATVWTCYICFAHQKARTFEFLKNLQEIVDNHCKRKVQYDFYEEAERKSHGITKWPLLIFFGAFYGVILISVIDIIVSDLIFGDLHPENWYTFYKMTIPFDRGSVSGFIGYFIIQFVLLHCYYAGLIPCFSFFVGTCHYLEACCNDLSEKFNETDKETASIRIKTKLIDIVTFHINVIEQFKLLTKIFSGVIFYQLSCGSAFISTTLFQLDLAWGTFDGNFFVISCVVALSIMCILPYCWFASVLSIRLYKISHDAYNSRWYTNSLAYHPYTRWIIIYGQISRNFDGYHIFKCGLDVFMKIIKASGSYYLMLKSF